MIKLKGLFQKIHGHEVRETLNCITYAFVLSRKETLNFEINSNTFLFFFQLHVR